MMEVVECAHCAKKLAMADGYTRLEIKCTRCGALNILRALSPQPERHRASDGDFYGNKKEDAFDGGHGR